MDSYSKNSIFRGKVKWIVCIVKAILQWILTPKLASLRGKVKWIVCIFTGILKWIFTPKIACFRGKVKGIVASMKPLKRPPQNVIQHHALKKIYLYVTVSCLDPLAAVSTVLLLRAMRAKARRKHAQWSVPKKVYRITFSTCLTLALAACRLPVFVHHEPRV